jgi:mRNA-degrading endonuclease toxin of MazEF toxin-antitoxin module
VLDQGRTVDHERLRKRLGTVSPATLQSVLRVLAEMFEI